MKLIQIFACLALFVAPVYSQLCWRRTYGRGVGTIPSQCDINLEKSGLLCYPRCNSGYKGVSFVCWQSCTSGFRDDGAFCFKPSSYGRGGGYPWKFGDGFNSNGQFSRCNRDHRQGCEKYGLIVYPKCRSGFRNIGCCVCSPTCPNGMVDIGVSCTKKSYTRSTFLPNCGSKEYDAGLCYNRCRTGYNGVGPVCWQHCPAQYPVNCGAACATSSAECTKGVVSMVTSVLDVVVNIVTTVASGGSATAAKTSAKMAIKNAASQLKNLTKNQIKTAIKKAAKDTAETLAENTANALSNAAQTGQFNWADLDPTGIANVVKAFNHKMCP